MKFNIPSLNFFFMLAYAYDLQWDWLIGEVSKDDFDDTTFFQVLTFILVKLTEKLRREGFYRSFKQETEKTKKIKGRILFTPTLKEQYFKTNKAVCQYDNLSFDVLENQILFSTLKFCHYKLRFEKNSKVKSYLEISLPKQIRILSTSVSYKNLSKELFYKLEFHRGNKRYEAVLKICRWIYDNFGIQRLGEEEVFDLSEEKMSDIFEMFLRNYLKEKLLDRGYYVKSKAPLNWVVGEDIESTEHIPIINPDIVISKKENPCLILDAKFYKEPVYDSSRFTDDSEKNENYKTKSHNLYQILSYSSYYNCDGILIYAQTEHGHFKEMVRINPTYYSEKNKPSFNFGFYTLDLSGSLNEFQERIDNFANDVIVKRIEKKVLN